MGVKFGVGADTIHPAKPPEGAALTLTAIISAGWGCGRLSYERVFV